MLPGRSAAPAVLVGRFHFAGPGRADSPGPSSLEPIGAVHEASDRLVRLRWEALVGTAR